MFFNGLFSVDENALNQSENEIVILFLYGNQKFRLQQNWSIFC